ncbi:MAG: hypothetical protein R3B07_16375 [Polyangiaceae bacterium]
MKGDTVASTQKPATISTGAYQRPPLHQRGRLSAGYAHR